MRAFKMVLFKSLLLVLISISLLWSKDYSEHHNRITKINYVSDVSIIQSNNVIQQISNDGLFPEKNGGIFLLNKNVMFPKVEDYYSRYYRNSGVIYQEGVLWGGKVKDGQSPILRVNGTTYKTGLTPGAILGIRTGNVEDPDDPNIKIWRVRRDWKTADLKEESFFLSKSEYEIRNTYQSDWYNWPVDKGAPFEDVDGDGQYNPDVDIPGVPGADQTIWYVANDINGVQIYGSPPIGIEMQMTLWTYNKTSGNPFGDMIFKRVRLIYKGTSSTTSDATIDSMFITKWIDPDIGQYTNDLVGCDTTLQLAFAYNSKNRDDEFEPFDMAPPAIGYMLLAGPTIPSNGDTAIINFEKRFNQKNLPIYGFYWLAKGYSEAHDPPFNDYQGTKEWYNLMRGFMPQPGYPDSKPWIDPLTSQPTRFPLSGDPIQKTGWYDGNYVAPSDRRMGLSVGPFQMALGDTQEVVFVFIGEQWPGRSGYLSSISNLKSKARSIKNFLQNGFSIGISTNIKQIPINKPCTLHSSIISLKKATHITTYQWKITKQPVNANANLINIQDSVVTFMANKEGFYTIQVKAITSEGQSAIGEITVYVFDDRPPKAVINLNKNEITWGDSILVDANASSDPEGDSLSFRWIIKSSSSYFHPNPIIRNTKASKTFVIPYHAGYYKVSLVASDGFLSDTVSTTFHVKPYMENMSIKNSLRDTAWYRGMPYYYQDNILIPMYKKGFMRIYKIDNNGFSFYKDVPLPNENISGIKYIKNNYIIFRLTDTTVGYYNGGPISISQFDDQWNLTPILSEYSPDGKYFYILQFKGDSALVYSDKKLYWIDFFTDPQNPKILKEGDFSSLQGVISSNKKFLFFVKDYNGDSLYIYDKFTFQFIKSVDWWKRFHYWIWGNGNEKRGDFKIINNYLFAGSTDSLSIYEIDTDFSLKHLSDIQFSPPFYNDIVEKSDIYQARLIKDNVLGVERFGFTMLYDFSVPQHPKEFALYGDGDYFYFCKINGHYLGCNWDLMSTDEIVEFSIPYLTGIKAKQKVLPLQFRLYHNYPNPFNPTTTIRYDLPQNSKVILTIYNILGQKVRTLVQKQQPAGQYQVQWDGRDDSGEKVSSGVYLYKMVAGDFVQVKKMLLVK